MGGTVMPMSVSAERVAWHDVCWNRAGSDVVLEDAASPRVSEALSLS